MRTIKFITGPAGTGKSYRLIELLKAETRNHLICAPTGIAAVAINGSTIHRTFKINPNTGTVGKRWPAVEVVYIDEVSMMGSKLFEQVVTGAPNADFIFIGDMAQLPPVKDKYWFESPYIGNFNIEIERLEYQWRQQECPELSLCLNKIRAGEVTSMDLRKLYGKSCHPDDNENPTTLAFRNDTVRAINAEKLLQLDSELFEFEASYDGLMKPNDCKAEQFLHVKAGAEVIMMNNDKDNRWQNGTRARIESINEIEIGLFNDKDYSITINIGGTKHTILEHTWFLKVPVELTPIRRNELKDELLYCSNESRSIEIEHALITGIEYVVIGTCKQFPLKLAYALTVHKSQGMTLDAVHIITSGFAGCPGIGYVALSRTRNLDYLSFDRKPMRGDFKFDQRIADWI